VHENTAANFEIKIDDLSFYNPDAGEWVAPGGKHKIMICTGAGEVLLEDTVKVPRSSKYGLAIDAKAAPSYFASDAFKPLGKDTEKIMKTPLISKKNETAFYTAPPTPQAYAKLSKAALKKLSKSGAQNYGDLTELSQFALEKLAKK
jgi:hypothetical protein